MKTPTRKTGQRRPQAPVAGEGALVRSDPADPLYLQVARTLRQEIVSGVHAVGSLLPTEDKLCERFGVSRYTVREALRLLREDGLVNSRRGAGTEVIPQRTTQTDIQHVMSINDLAAFAGDTRFEIDTLGTTTLTKAMAKRSGLDAGQDWLRVSGFRHSKQEAGAPLCQTEYFINRMFAAVGRMLPRHSGSVFALIENMFGRNIVEVQQQISATLLSAELAGILAVEPASPALTVRRSYITADGTTAQVTINTHPASRFQHAMTMRRMRT